MGQSRRQGGRKREREGCGIKGQRHLAAVPCRQRVARFSENSSAAPKRHLRQTTTTATTHESRTATTTRTKTTAKCESSKPNAKNSQKSVIALSTRRHQQEAETRQEEERHRDEGGDGCESEWELPTSRPQPSVAAISNWRYTSSSSRQAKILFHQKSVPRRRSYQSSANFLPPATFSSFCLLSSSFSPPRAHSVAGTDKRQQAWEELLATRVAPFFGCNCVWGRACSWSRSWWRSRGRRWSRLWHQLASIKVFMRLPKKCCRHHAIKVGILPMWLSSSNSRKRSISSSIMK